MRMILCGLAIAVAARPSRAGTATAPSANELLQAVRPFPGELLHATGDERNRRLMQGYYDSIRAWSEILAQRFRPVPGRPGQGYYGDGGHEEDDIRPLGYAALVNAFLSEANPPAVGIDAAARTRCREQAVAVLRYLAAAHVTGGEKCANGKPWGNQWQSAMWARSAGLGGWIIWEHLDRDLQLRLARLLEYEADRFIEQLPKNARPGDTGAEENAWNAHVTSLCCNMMPSHPHGRAWDESAKRYMYNSLSVAADKQDTRPGDDGRRVCDWVTTVNAQPDFTVENHGLVHIGYLKTTMAELVENAAQYLIGGQQPPAACFHHLSESWTLLLRCMSGDGAPIYFGGNDWKGVHTQPNDIVIYAMLNLLRDDRDAACVEQVALDVLGRIQRQQGGYYGVRRDIEQGGFVASRLITCYFGHAARGAGARPATAAQFNDRARGLLYLEHGQAILHRTPAKFASFAWGPKRLALAWPTDGTWAVWPHYSSYLGRLNEEDSDAKHARLERIRHELLPDGFTVVGTLLRCDGGVRQDFAYVSPPGDFTVYVERLSPLRDGGLSRRETGIIGHDYPPGENERTLHGRQGTVRVTAVGGTDQVLEIESNWLSIGDCIGYVVCRPEGRTNLMRYHDFARGQGRVPELQEWLSLVGDRTPPRREEDWACVVTVLGQTAARTRSLAEAIRFVHDGRTAECRMPAASVRVDFGSVRPSARLTPTAGAPTTDAASTPALHISTGLRGGS